LTQEAILLSAASELDRDDKDKGDLLLVNALLAAAFRKNIVDDGATADLGRQRTWIDLSSAKAKSGRINRLPYHQLIGPPWPRRKTARQTKEKDLPENNKYSRTRQILRGVRQC